MIDLDELIRKVRELRPLPASAVRLAALIHADIVDLELIAEVVAYDQALTLTLIRAANSAFDAGLMQVSDPRDAVFRLGMGRVLALSVAASAGPLMRVELPLYGMDEGGLWRHSVAAAAVAETLPDFCEEELPLATFAAALLHDVGKLIIGRFLRPDSLAAMRRLQTEQRCDSLQAEREVLGMHHGELGGAIAQHWGMPDSIIKGIAFHHEPDKGRELICDAVYLANHIAKAIGARSPQPNPQPEVLRRLGLPTAAIAELGAEATKRFVAISARYNA